MAQPKTDQGLIKSVQKSLQMLKYIINSPEEVGITELEREFGYNSSTIHHLVKTMMVEGFLSQNSRTKRYHVGPELLNTWLQYNHLEKYFQRAMPILEEVVAATEETTSLFIRRDREAVCVLGKESPRTLRAFLVEGRRIPLHCTATGKAFLAYLPEEKVRQLAVHGLERYMDNTITEVEALLSDLAMVRERGYAVELEEYEETINAVGVPIFIGVHGEPKAVLAMIGPSTRLTNERIREVAPYLAKRAGEVAQRLWEVVY